MYINFLYACTHYKYVYSMYMNMHVHVHACIHIICCPYTHHPSSRQQSIAQETYALSIGLLIRDLWGNTNSIRPN